MTNPFTGPFVVGIETEAEKQARMDAFFDRLRAKNKARRNARMAALKAISKRRYVKVIGKTFKKLVPDPIRPHMDRIQVLAKSISGALCNGYYMENGYGLRGHISYRTLRKHYTDEA